MGMEPDLGRRFGWPTAQVACWAAGGKHTGLQRIWFTGRRELMGGGGSTRLMGKVQAREAHKVNATFQPCPTWELAGGPGR